jgi:nitroreductase
VVSDRDVVEEVRKRSYRGLPNKINLWLARTPVSGFLAMITDTADPGLDRPIELPKVVMAMEDCVLWLAERGIGTCWLAGVNSKEIVDALGLGDGAAVPVLIPFGKPKERIAAADFDALMYGALSRRRKPLTDIAFTETVDTPYDLKNLGKVGFTAPPVQDVRGLLGELEMSTGAAGTTAPLDLTVDAMLESARIAPSGGNFQQWQFVVIRDGRRLEELAAAGGAGAGWRAAVVGAGSAKRLESVWFDKPFWMIDVPITFSHMSLVAASAGAAAEIRVEGIDEAAVSSLVGLRRVMRVVGAVGLR